MRRIRGAGLLLLLALVAALVAVPAAVGQEGVAISAHRGGAAYAPENTMVAFRNAVRLGADILEMDAQLSQDGVVVLIHDDTLDRTTDCTGPVNELTYDQLQGCDAAYWFHPGQPTTQVDEDATHPLRATGVTIPTAAEVFAYVASLGDRAPEISIEIKDIPGEANFDPAGTVVAAELVPLIQDSGIAELIHVQSFWPPAIEAVKMMDPSIRTLFLSTPEVGVTASENLTYVVSRGHDISAPAWTTPDAGPQAVELAHAAGKQFVPWTVDDRADLETVLAWAPDAIITNFPACLADVQGRSRPADVRPPELVTAGSAPLGACPGDEPAAVDPGDDPAPEPDAEPDPATDDGLPATGGGAALAALATLLSAALWPYGGVGTGAGTLRRRTMRWTPESRTPR